MPRKYKGPEIQPVLFVKAKDEDITQTENCSKEAFVKTNDELFSAGRNIKSFYDDLVGSTSNSESSPKPNNDIDTMSPNTAKAQRRKDIDRNVTESNDCKRSNTRGIKKGKLVDRNITEFNDCKRSNTRGIKKGKLVKSKVKSSATSECVADSKDCNSSNKFSERDKLNFLRLAQEGDTKALGVYLNEGMDVNVTDQFGWTALMCASCAGRRNVVKLLLMKEADRMAVNSQEQTARDIALEMKKQDIVDLLNSSNLDEEHIDLDSSNTSFYCNICKCNITESSKQAHSTSTLHLFNSNLPLKGTDYFLTESNKGFRLMVQKGWDKEKGLGAEGQGQKFPVKTILKRDRLGLGNKVKVSAKVTHFGPKDSTAVKNPKVREMRKSTLSKRKKSRQERTEQNKEKAFRREFYMN